MATFEELGGAAEAEPFKDRTGGLVAFGILLLGLSFLALCMTGLVVLGYFLNPNMSAAMLAPSVFIYGIVTLILAVLGFGSMAATRWARALTLTIMAMTLVFGLVSLLFVPVLLLHFEPPMPPEAAQAGPGQAALMKGIMFVTVGVVFMIQVLLPVPFILFYRSRHVKTTCEWKHPQPSWTDACPLPVLAVVLLMAFSVAYLMVLSISAPAFPWMDTIVVGPTASAIMLVFAAVTAFITWGLYRLKPGAWWALLVLLIVGAVFGGYTIYQLDFMGYMAAVGMPSAEVEMLEGSGLETMYQQPLTLFMMAIAFLFYLAYVVYIRRYFTAARA